MPLFAVAPACGHSAANSSAPAPLRGAGSTTAPTTVATLPPVVAGFIAFGDFGGGVAQDDVAVQMQRWIDAGHRVDALVTTGDNVYPAGDPADYEPELVRSYESIRAKTRPL